MPEELSQISFNPVTNNSASNFLAGRDTQPRRLKVVFTPHNKKPLYSCFMLCGSELKKFGSLPQTSCFWKCGCGINIHAGMYLFCRDSYGQVFTPFCPSALNNQPAILCGHPYQKSVGTLAWSIAWLECSFHLNLPLQNYFSGNGLLNTTPHWCQVLYYIQAWHSSIWFALKKRGGSAILQHLQQV